MKCYLGLGGVWVICVVSCGTHIVAGGVMVVVILGLWVFSWRGKCGYRNVD